MNNINNLQIYGSVSIVTIPSGATVFIDDIEQTSTTPALIEDIPVGVHTYRLTLAGYIDIIGVMYIEPDKTYNVFTTMEQPISRTFIFGAFASLLAGITLYLFTKNNVS